MIGTAFEVYREVDPAKKNAVWADHVITVMRRDWRPLINPIRAAKNKKLLFSQQSMDKIISSFKDKEFKRTIDFNPLGIMENIKNALVEEITKLPPKAELRATDPTALNEKEQDLQLLKHRKIVEADISKYQKQVGLPNYKLSNDNYKSNVKEFDKMGLDERDPDDLSFFERNIQRLGYEIAGQAVINNIMKVNRFDEERIEDFVIDILAYKTICLQSYVDKITGEIKQRYVYPETAYGIFGDANDGADDTCRGWQDSVTVMQWLQMVGDEFNWERDWWQLLWAINYANGYKYTGFIRNGVVYDCCTNGSIMSRMGFNEETPADYCEWTLAYTYKVYVGYIEWNTAEATGSYLRKTKEPGYVDRIPYSYDLKKKQQVEGYYKEDYYQQQWYRSYFISTTSVSQWIYDFGKVYYQQFKGANDEYASGTLTYYRKKGRSAVEIAEPYIHMAEFCFYRMLWVIHHAKPMEDEIVIEELIQVAKGFQRLFQQTTGNNNVPTLDNILNSYIQYQRENLVRIRSFPQVDGRTVMQLPPLDGKRNGIDPIWVSLQAIVTWAEMQAATKIGMNPMRFGANPPSRESSKSETNSIGSSFNATGYIYRMVQFLKERVATTTLNFTLDILKYKDSAPYHWLKTMVGTEDFNSLALLNEFAAHRYGLFVRDYNIDIDKQKVLFAADQAFQKGQIDFDQWFIIIQTEDVKKAAQILSFMKIRQAKKQRQMELQNFQIQDQLDEKKHKRELDRINAKGEWDYKKAEKEAEGYVAASEKQADSRIVVKEMQIKNEPVKQASKSEGQKEIAETRENLKEQHPYPAAKGG